MKREKITKFHLKEKDREREQEGGGRERDRETESGKERFKLAVCLRYKEGTKE